jgi:putative tributyrin esterase
MAGYFRTIEISNPAYQPDQLRLVTVKSRYLKGRADCTLFISSQIKKVSNATPVVILLHGVYGSHWAWTYNINVHAIASKLISQKKVRPMILVMPSDGLAGDGSGYFDQGDKNFEKWITKDVVEIVKAVVGKGDNSKLNLFIAGLSMGGYGALRLMAKNPTLFTAASGLSSITTLKELLPFLPVNEQVAMKKKFGSERLIDYLMKNRKNLPPFRFDCGLNDGLMSANRLLHRQLDAAKIKHDFYEYDGGHSNEYWTAHIGETLKFFDQQADRPTGRT